MDKWRGKIAVVTGGSSGMGASIAEKFIDNGISVINLDLNVSSSKSPKIFFIKCDVTDLESIKSAFKLIEDKFSFIHIIVNCAGIWKHGSILNTNEETTKVINDLIATNFTGLVHCSREGYRLIKKSDDYGIIINFSSIVGHIIPFPIPAMVYAATKHAVRAYSEIFRQELVVAENSKIRVSNISPGYVMTNILDESGMPNLSEFKKNPSIKAEDVANAILYLLSTPFNVNVTELTIRPLGEKM